MIKQTDASTVIGCTRALLLSMVVVGRGFGGAAGFDVWLWDRDGRLCVHKTVGGVIRGRV